MDSIHYIYIIYMLPNYNNNDIISIKKFILL